MSNQDAWRILHAIRELKEAMAMVDIAAPKEIVFANSQDGWHLQDMLQDAGMLSATTDATPEGTDLLGEIDGVRLRWPMSGQPSSNPALNPRGAWLPPQSTNTLVPEPKEYVSDGSTASYYELPERARELQDLISYRNMNAQDGEIFRAIYRKGLAKHSDALRDAKKVKFYADAEVERLEKLNQSESDGAELKPLPDNPEAIVTGAEVALMDLTRDVKALMHRVWRLEVKTGALNAKGEQG